MFSFFFLLMMMIDFTLLSLALQLLQQEVNAIKNPVDTIKFLEIIDDGRMKFLKCFISFMKHCRSMNQLFESLIFRMKVVNRGIKFTAIGAAFR